MLEVSLMIVFWYGVLHAFGPDHLTAIADFSIGRQRKRVFLVTLGFALGHGLSLYLFALLISLLHVSDEWLKYGDLIASGVILYIGLYLLYLVATDRIQVSKHMHDGKEHIHIWFGQEHRHKQSIFSGWRTSAVIGGLMGMSGARGMLISLSVISSQEVSGGIVLSFTLGVALVFIIFGVLLAALNQRLVASPSYLTRAFMVTGVISCLVGGQAFI